MSGLKVPWKFVAAGAGTFLIFYSLSSMDPEPSLFRSSTCKGQWEEYQSKRETGVRSIIRQARKAYYQCHYKAYYKVAEA